MRSYTSDFSRLPTELVGCAERLRIYANRVQFSQGWATLYALMIFLNAFLLVWAIAEADYPLGHAIEFWVFVIIDCAVTLFVLLEIALNWCAQGPLLFCALWSNRFDMLVALLLIGALLLHVLGPASEVRVRADVQLYDGTEAVVLTIRYAAQLVRLVTLLKNYRRQTRQKALEIVIDCDDTADLATPPTSPELSPEGGDLDDDAHFGSGTSMAELPPRANGAVDDIRLPPM